MWNIGSFCFGKDTMDNIAANMGRGTLNNRVQTPCVSPFISFLTTVNHVYQLAGRRYCEGRYCSWMRLVVVLAVTLVALLAPNFKVHMAIVFNEYGGTTWIVTLDDVLEEIVGEVYKEIDSRMEECSQRLQALPLAIGSRKSQYTTGARVAIERLILAEYEVKLTATNEVEYENAPACRQARKLEFIMCFGNSIAQSRKRTAEMKLSLPAMPIIFFDEADQMLAADGLHTLNLELMFNVTISFDPGGIAYSSETWKPVTSIRRVHLFQCSFLDVAAPNGPFGVGFENIFVPSIISHEDCMVNSFSMCFGHDGRRIFSFDDTGLLLRQIRKSIGQMNDEHVEGKKMELKEMVKIFQQGNIATFMAVLSVYSMWNQIEHFCDMVLNMENDGLALDVVFYIELIHRLFTQRMLHVIVGGCIDMHDLNRDFMWVQAMFLELLTVQMTFCICSLGGIFLKMFSEGLILGLLQHQTRGRVTPLEGWNDDKNAKMEMKQITVKFSVVIIDSFGNVLWKNGQSWEYLKLFHNAVNGLDPPVNLDGVRKAYEIDLVIAYPISKTFIVADSTSYHHWMMHKHEGPNSRTSLLFLGTDEMMH